MGCARLRCFLFFFFHTGFRAFPGGYLGVDVFFVISGYLMCALIWSDVQNSGFSLRGFYERRARRILPALLFVIMFWLAVSCILVPPKLLADAGFSTWTSIAFSANIAFWIKTLNYFDGRAEWNPFLHTWSLSVEEQFYLLFPLFLTVTAGIGSFAGVLAGIWVATLGSFLLSVWAVANAPTASFYLLPTRAWELLLGASLAMFHFTPENFKQSYCSGILRNSFGLIGISLIVGCVLFYDRETPFPGMGALLPCLGAILIIHGGKRGDEPAARILSLSYVTFIGMISYSLYLWHWPIIVFAKNYELFGNSSYVQTAAILAGSFIGAYASWRWVEQPVRRKKFLSSRPALAGGLLTVAVSLTGIGLLLQYSGGWSGTFRNLQPYR